MCTWVVEICSSSTIDTIFSPKIIEQLLCEIEFWMHQYLQESTANDNIVDTWQNQERFQQG